MLFLLEDESSINRKFIIALPFNFNRNKFFELAKVSGNSYAYKILCRIIDVFTKNVKNLSYEYKTYFSMEYDDFILFLKKEYNISEEILDEFKNYCDLNKYNVFIGSANGMGDYNIGGLFYNEQVTNTLKALLAGYINEN